MTATAKKKCFVSERKVTPCGQSKGFVRYPLKNLRRPTTTVRSMRGSRKFSRGGGGGGPNSQKGSYGKFQYGKN